MGRTTLASAWSATGGSERPSEQFALLICIKYGADKETERYLESIRSVEAQQRLQVLVVDNTVDGNWASTSSQGNCRVVQTHTNLGYFGGARYGLSLYLAENPLPDWVIISNVDLLLEGPRLLERLAQLGSIPDLGAVAPRIRSALTGIDQNPYMRVRPSALRMHMYKWLFRSWIILNIYEGLAALFRKIRGGINRLYPESSHPLSQETIYAPHGSFLIFSRYYFERGGDLDFPEFLFGEEIYIAENMRRLGLRVAYEPSLRVTHQEHHSTKLLKSRRVAKYLAYSAAYCADTFFPNLTRS